MSNQGQNSIDKWIENIDSFVSTSTSTSVSLRSETTSASSSSSTFQANLEKCINALTKLYQSQKDGKLDFDVSTGLINKVVKVYTDCLNFSVKYPVQDPITTRQRSDSMQSRYTTQSEDEEDGTKNNSNNDDNDRQGVEGILRIWNLSSSALSHLINTGSKQFIRNSAHKIVDALVPILTSIHKYRMNRRSRSKRFYSRSSTSTTAAPQLSNNNCFLLGRKSTILTCLRLAQSIIERSKPIPPVLLKATIEYIIPLIYIGLPDIPSTANNNHQNAFPPSLFSRSLRSSTSNDNLSIYSPSDWMPSDTEIAQYSSRNNNNNNNDGNDSSFISWNERIRIAALRCIKSTAEYEPKSLQAHWFSLFPTNPKFSKTKDLISVIEYEQQLQCQTLLMSPLACDAMIYIMKNSISYLAIADDKPSQAAFTPLSTRLGKSVIEIHSRLAKVLSLTVNTTNLQLKMLVTNLIICLVKSTPYQRFNNPMFSLFWVPCLDSLEKMDAGCELLVDSESMIKMFHLLATITEKLDSNTITSEQKSRVVTLLVSNIKEGSSKHVLESHGFMQLIGYCIPWCNNEQMSNLVNYIVSRMKSNMDENLVFGLKNLLNTCINNDNKAVNDFILLKLGQENELETSLKDTVSSVMLLSSSSSAPELDVKEKELITVLQILKEIPGTWWDLYCLDGYNILWPIEICIQIGTIEIISTNTRKEGIRTLGTLSKHSCFVDKLDSFTLIYNYVKSICFENVHVEQASWTLANLCDSIGELVSEEKLSFGLPYKHLLELGISLSLNQESEQTLVSSTRIIGFVLSTAPVGQECWKFLEINNLHNTDLFLERSGIGTLQSLFKNGPAKVRWNAGTALGSILKNPLFQQEHTQNVQVIISLLVNDLLSTLNSDKNFKVRTSAITALCNINWANQEESTKQEVKDRLNLALNKVESDKASLGFKEMGHAQNLQKWIQTCTGHI